SARAGDVGRTDRAGHDAATSTRSPGADLHTQNGTRHSVDRDRDGPRVAGDRLLVLAPPADGGIRSRLGDHRVHRSDALADGQCDGDSILAGFAVSDRPVLQPGHVRLGVPDLPAADGGRVRAVSAAAMPGNPSISAGPAALPSAELAGLLVGGSRGMAATTQ